MPKGGASSTLLPREALDSGTDIQKRWAAKFADGRATQLMSGDENMVAEAVGAMREATQQGWVSPELLQQLRVIAGRGMRESGAQRRAVAQQRQAARQARGSKYFPEEEAEGSQI